MKKIIIFIALISFISLASIPTANAGFFRESNKEKITDYFGLTIMTSGYDIDDKYALQVAVASIIRFALALMGTGFLILILYGGFTWMSAQGNEEKVKQARSIIGNATIGLLIVITAFSLSTYLLDNLINAVEGRGLVDR